MSCNEGGKNVYETFDNSLQNHKTVFDQGKKKNMNHSQKTTTKPCVTRTDVKSAP